MIGIDVLKGDLVVIAKIINKVDGALVDDKITWAEWAGLAVETPRLFKIAKTYKMAVEELKDLTAVEINELVEAFIAEFDIANDVAEQKVEQVLGVVAAIAGAFVKE